MERTHLTSDDTGKRVVNANGDEIGMVSEVEGDTARVDPDPDLSGSIKSKLGWGDSDQADYVLKQDRVSMVTDDEVRISD